VPTSITEIHGQKEEQVPALSVFNLLHIKAVGMKKECGFLSHGGCVLKIGATGVSVAGIAVNLAAVGASITVNGFKHDFAAMELKGKGAPKINLAAFLIKV